MKLIYEIAAPSFDEFFNSEKLVTDDDDLKYNYKIFENIEEIVNPRYHQFMNFNWTSVLYFKKSLSLGSIHTDLAEISDIENKCAWGISWVLENDGIMDYWKLDNLKILGKTDSPSNYSALKNKIGIVPSFFPLGPPDYQYSLTKGKVYLVNASLPHRAIGMKNRKVFSLRTEYSFEPWQSIVECFASRII